MVRSRLSRSVTPLMGTFTRAPPLRSASPKRYSTQISSLTIFRLAICGTSRPLLRLTVRDDDQSTVVVSLEWEPLPGARNHGQALLSRRPNNSDVIVRYHFQAQYGIGDNRRFRVQPDRIARMKVANLREHVAARNAL